MKQKEFTKEQINAIDSLGRAFQLCKEVGLVFEGRQFFIHAYRKDNYEQASKNLPDGTDLYNGIEPLKYCVVSDKGCYKDSGADDEIYFK